jgi:hypothetical protein
MVTVLGVSKQNINLFLLSPFFQLKNLTQVSFLVQKALHCVFIPGG